MTNNYRRKDSFESIEVKSPSSNMSLENIEVGVKKKHNVEQSQQEQLGSNNYQSYIQNKKMIVTNMYPPQCYCDTREHKQLIKSVSNGRQNQKYVDLNEYMANSKNEKVKSTAEFKGTQGIHYDNDNDTWGFLSHAIMQPKSSEGRQLWQEMENFHFGIRDDMQNGYQYQLGNFPIVFKQKQAKKDLIIPDTQQEDLKIPGKKVSQKYSSMRMQERDHYSPSRKSGSVPRTAGKSQHKRSIQYQYMQRRKTGMDFMNRASQSNQRSRQNLYIETDDNLNSKTDVRINKFLSPQSVIKPMEKLSVKVKNKAQLNSNRVQYKQRVSKLRNQIKNQTNSAQCSIQQRLESQSNNRYKQQMRSNISDSNERQLKSFKSNSIPHELKSQPWSNSNLSSPIGVSNNFRSTLLSRQVKNQINTAEFGGNNTMKTSYMALDQDPGNTLKLKPQNSAIDSIHDTQETFSTRQFKKIKAKSSLNQHKIKSREHHVVNSQSWVSSVNIQDQGEIKSVTQSRESSRGRNSLYPTIPKSFNRKSTTKSGIKLENQNKDLGIDKLEINKQNSTKLSRRMFLLKKSYHTSMHNKQLLV